MGYIHVLIGESPPSRKKLLIQLVDQDSIKHLNLWRALRCSLYFEEAA